MIHDFVTIVTAACMGDVCLVLTLLALYALYEFAIAWPGWIRWVSRLRSRDHGIGVCTCTPSAWIYVIALSAGLRILCICSSDGLRHSSFPACNIVLMPPPTVLLSSSSLRVERCLFQRSAARAPPWESQPLYFPHRNCKQSRLG